MKQIAKINLARMPQSCWGSYIRVAVVATTDGRVPARISEHAANVVKVVSTWEKCRTGLTERCAARRAIKAAEELAERLNREHAAKQYVHLGVA